MRRSRITEAMPKDRTIPKTAQKREAGFWKQFRTALTNRAKQKTLNWTRLETWAMPGVPDVVLQDHKGRFHFVELKATGSNAVDLRPHQVSWLTKHGHGSVWILVKQETSKMPKPKLYLFGGKDAVDLKMEGLTAVESYAELESPFDWEEVIDLILL